MEAIAPAQWAVFERACQNRPHNWPAPVVIYGLCDPETGAIRYIGKTTAPKSRLAGHIRETGQCHRVNWLRSLTARGVRPVMVFLEMLEGESAREWQFHERWWIAYASANDWPLVNGTSGGDGVKDLAPESRERIRQAWIGRALTDEHKAKISAYRKTWRASDETRARMRASQTGRKITWGKQIAEAVRKLSDADIAEIRRHIAEGATVAEMATRYSVHRTTISKVKAGLYLWRGQKGQPENGEMRQPEIPA